MLAKWLNVESVLASSTARAPLDCDQLPARSSAQSSALQLASVPVALHSPLSLRLAGRSMQTWTRGLLLPATRLNGSCSGSGTSQLAAASSRSPGADTMTPPKTSLRASGGQPRRARSRPVLLTVSIWGWSGRSRSSSPSMAPTSTSSTPPLADLGGAPRPCPPLS